jgi:monomeric isocitrate dehydrogenase
MVLKVVLRRVPTSVNAAIAATAISAAINVYSIAVTPSRSSSNLWSMHVQAHSQKVRYPIIINKKINFYLTGSWALHRELANAAAEAERVATMVPLCEGAHFMRQRRAIRDALAENGIAAVIDALVSRLLDR